MHEPSKGVVSTIRENYRRHLVTTDSIVYKLYRRNPTSTPCTCYNDVREESEDPECKICGGSGYTTNYIFVQDVNFRVINPKNEIAFIKEIFGEMDVDMRAFYGWTLHDPIIMNEDVIIETFSDDAYEIQNIVSSMIGNKCVRQSIQAKKNTRIPGVMEVI